MGLGFAAQRRSFLRDDQPALRFRPVLKYSSIMQRRMIVHDLHIRARAPSSGEAADQLPIRPTDQALRPAPVSKAEPPRIGEQPLSATG